MILEFAIISQLVVSIYTNPFHKYPFVFLLDVGNEELENANTEQIRVTAPGGSIALRYPAVGEGDTIAHVRVSGIDFGTDLKANIYDGGPGYKYVVLGFAGNPGVAYDAVVTLQTIASDNVIDDNTVEKNVDSNAEGNNIYQVDEIDKVNNSAEDTSENGDQKGDDQNNEELTQAGSNYYNYARNEVNNNEHENSNNDEVNNFDNESDDSDKYNNIRNSIDREDIQAYKESFESEPHSQDDQNNNDLPRVEKYTSNIDYSEERPNSEPVKVIDSNLYNKYEALRPHLNTDVKIYPSETSLEDEESANINPEDDIAEIDQMFNDEEVHNGQKYKDASVKSNYYDTDDPAAVAS